MKGNYSEEDKRHYRNLSIGIFFMSFAMSFINGIVLCFLSRFVS